MNPLYIIFGVPLALLLLVKPAHAPDKEPESKWQKKPVWRGVAPIRTSRIAKPELVAELARKWSPVFKTPVEWLRSMAYAESRNMPEAVNEVTGAMGVLQVMPDTAKWLVSSLAKSKFATIEIVKETLAKATTLTSLLDPNVNIMLAAYYIMLLKKRFRGDYDHVAAAYNMGPNKIAYYVDNRLPLPERSLAYLAMVRDGKRRGYT